MSLDKSHKFMVFMTNVYENTEMRMFGNILQIYSIFYHLRHWWRMKFSDCMEYFIIFYTFRDFLHQLILLIILDNLIERTIFLFKL